MQRLAILFLIYSLITACACTNQTEKGQQENISTPTTTNKIPMDTKKQEHQLHAKGKASNWSLTMGLNKLVNFKTDQSNISAKVSEITTSSDGNMLTFMTDANEQLYFNLIPTNNQSYTIQVVSKASGKEEIYKGKAVLAGQFRLNNDWHLVNLNGKSVPQGEDTPNLNIGLFNEKLFGFTGCNRIMGTVSLDDKAKLNFGMLNMTRMACTDDKYESLMMATLRAEEVNVSIEANGQMKITDGKQVLLFDAK